MGSPSTWGKHTVLGRQPISHTHSQKGFRPRSCFMCSEQDPDLHLVTQFKNTMGIHFLG